ncbi:STAS domain-containing protein [Domibacillus epiphyticus]|uniref:Anti-sigma factor antagonist n=1 Tax=Domibacillus epiphyticus TaxID=1714355 RepID=A0A1V2A944_9BACI|nr:STAS domain-containing protein [Domibacillus epiphyticus]OMP67513.1 anti-anti-sigma factor [Domibacillus epiphyticus]
MIDYLMKETEDGKIVVRLNGDLDIDSTEIVEEELLPAMEKYKKANIDFENVPFVDSSGMGLLLNIVQSLKEKGINVTISNVREDVQVVFDLLQIPEILGDETFI